MPKFRAIRSSDIDTDLPLVSANLFTKLLGAIQLLYRFKLADFEACHRYID
jgi:hypothetical protein